MRFIDLIVQPALLLLLALVALGPSTSAQTSTDPIGEPGLSDVAPLQGRVDLAALDRPRGTDRTTADTPEALVERVLGAFVAGDPDAFAHVFPESSGRQLLDWAAEYGWPLVASAGRVARQDGDHAVVALAGYPEVGNAGQESALARMVTGLYEAERGPTGWRLTRRLPVDAGNRILSQSLSVALRPGVGLDVVDTLSVEVSNPDGFWAYLNRAVRLDAVEADGRPVPHRLDAGLLWVGVPPGRHRVCLAYAVERARDGAENGNFSHFGETYGHVRDQHFWHPGFETGSEAGVADFRLALQAPADVQVVTGAAQADAVVGGVRRVTARSERPVSGLSLFYDRDWRPSRRPLGGLEAGVYLGDGFEPARAEVEAGLDRVHRVLSARFGEPATRHVALVQVRGASSTGWHFRSGAVVGVGARGGPLSTAGAAPSHNFAHEVAHNWTNPTGPGALFLSEGWATFAEALVLADEHGPEVERAFWERQRVLYLRSGYEGTASLLGDTFNGGVSYAKGAWVLRMLRDAVGEAAFEAGVRAYLATPPGEPADVEAFTLAVSAATGRDVGPFLRPWLEETTIPDVDARLDGDRLVVVQRGPVFPLSVEVELATPAGPVRRQYELTAREHAFDLVGMGATDAVVDPDGRLLIRRYWGEVVRFTLDAPDAGEVFLLGVAAAPVPAVLVDGLWTVEVPLTAGRYAYAWRVDGARRAADEPDGRVVAPRVRLDPAHVR